MKCGICKVEYGRKKRYIMLTFIKVSSALGLDLTLSGIYKQAV